MFQIKLKNIFTRVLKGHIAVALSDIKKRKMDIILIKLQEKVSILLVLIIVMELVMELEHFLMFMKDHKEYQKITM